MASAGEIDTLVRGKPTVWKVWRRLRLMAEVRRRHWIRLCRVADSLAWVLTWEIDVESWMIEIIVRVRYGCRHIEIRKWPRLDWRICNVFYAGWQRYIAENQGRSKSIDLLAHLSAQTFIIGLPIAYSL